MTYKSMLLGKLKYLILLFIAIQSGLLALMAIFFTGTQYQDSWQNYNRTSETVTVYLQQLSEEQSASVFQYFLEQDELSIWTQHSEQDNTQSGLKKIYIDILGSSAGFSEMIYTGKTVVSRQQMKKLLSNSDNRLTIGLDKGSDSMLYGLPRLLFITPVVIDRLDYVFQKTKSINGIYYINGLQDDSRREAFLSKLSTITGISVEKLTNENFGSHIDYGIVPIVLGVSILVSALILLILFLICVLQSFKHFGTLILLGWDRKALWTAFFKMPLLFSIYLAPIAAVILWLLSGWSEFGLQSLPLIFAGSSLSIILLCLTIVIPSMIVYLISPLAAIHKRLPMKSLMSISLVFYTLVAGALIATSHSLDAPLGEVLNNVRVSNEWKNVEDMYVISDFVEGNDVGALSGTANSLEKSMYRFYQRISEIPGVYIAQGEYHDQKYLDTVQGVYQHVPKKPFWYLTYSDNYLSDLGIKLSDEELSKVKSGTRLYLIPNTLGDKEIEVMKAYLQESVKVDEGDVETRFTKNRQFLFKVYQPSKSIFTWSTSISNGFTSRSPVIFVASSENLYFLESANLYVTGYNGILKFRDRKTMNQVKNILKNDFPDLLDNKIKFKTVKNYINGLQKDLSYTFYLFGSVIAIIVVFLVSIFWSFIVIYRLLFEEKLNVQYFIGFSPWRRYIGVLFLVVGVSVIELLSSILLGSKLGIVLTLSTFSFQVFLLYFSLFRNEGKNILQTFKG